MPRLSYSVLDVFTSAPYAGNQLAIVHTPISANITSSQKQLIAREFGFSETVFLDDSIGSGEETSVTISIFGTDKEIPFGGHPAVGVGFYLLSGLSGDPKPSRLTLKTKAGEVPIIEGDSGAVGVEVPIDFKIHPSYELPDLKLLQPGVATTDYVNGPEPIVSIVKGMTFIMLQLASEEAISKLQPYPEPMALPDGYLGEWDGMVGVYAFYLEKEGNSLPRLRTRMFYGNGHEDAASGSAACALGGWLAKHKGMKKLQLVQGVEMARRSEMGIAVTLDSQNEVARVVIEGSAVRVMKGELEV